MRLETIDHCPVCRSRTVSHAGFADVWKCRSCALMFRNPRPELEEILRHQRRGASYRRMARLREELASAWDERVRLLHRFIASGKLLDVGAGDGEFVLRATAAGFETLGTEVSETACRLALERGVRLELSDVRDLALEEGSFDVVTLWHVLEHLFEPLATLRRIRELLAPGGLLVVAVPNENWSQLKMRLGVKRATTVPEDGELGHELHLLRFVPWTLKGIVVRSGFDLLAFGVDNASTGWSFTGAAMRAFQKGLCHLTGWHFAPAMYVVARRPPDGAVSAEPFRSPGRSRSTG